MNVGWVQHSGWTQLYLQQKQFLKDTRGCTLLICNGFLERKVSQLFFFLSKLWKPSQQWVVPDDVAVQLLLAVFPWSGGIREDFLLLLILGLAIPLYREDSEGDRKMSSDTIKSKVFSQVPKHSCLVLYCCQKWTTQSISQKMQKPLINYIYWKKPGSRDQEYCQLLKLRRVLKRKRSMSSLPDDHTWHSWNCPHKVVRSHNVLSNDSDRNSDCS